MVVLVNTPVGKGQLSEFPMLKPPIPTTQELQIEPGE